jgi:hypothetical protein
VVVVAGAAAEAAGREDRGAAAAAAAAVRHPSGLVARFPVIQFPFVVAMEEPVDWAETAATAAKVVTEELEDAEVVAEARLKFSPKEPSKLTPLANSGRSVVNRRAVNLALPAQAVVREASVHRGNLDVWVRHTPTATEDPVAPAATVAAAEMAAVVDVAATAVTARMAPAAPSNCSPARLSGPDL